MPTHPFLAHQGGWDEILLPALIVLGVLGVSRWRRRSAGTAGEPSSTPPAAKERVCGYCGGPLTPNDVRCPSCGFRTPLADG